MSNPRKAGKPPRKNADGSTTYGPYKGSSTVDGRKIKVTSPGKGQPGKGSTSAARDEQEQHLGHKLRKDQHVDHIGKKTNKQGNKSTSVSSTRVVSRKENIGKENKRRAGKK